MTTALTFQDRAMQRFDNAHRETIKCLEDVVSASDDVIAKQRTALKHARKAYADEQDLRKHATEHIADLLAVIETLEAKLEKLQSTAGADVPALHETIELLESKVETLAQENANLIGFIDRTRAELYRDQLK